MPDDPNFPPAPAQPEPSAIVPPKTVITITLDNYKNVISWSTAPNAVPFPVLVAMLTQCLMIATQTLFQQAPATVIPPKSQRKNR